MSREEFIELWECGTIYFDDIVDIAHHMDLESFYSVYSRDDIGEYIDNEVKDIAHDIVWEDLRSLLNDAYTDIYENQFDYYDTGCGFGDMGIYESEYDTFFLYFREEMDANDLWENDDFQEFIWDTFDWATPYIDAPIDQESVKIELEEIDNIEEFIFV